MGYTAEHARQIPEQVNNGKNSEQLKDIFQFLKFEQIQTLDIPFLDADQ